MLLSSRSRDYAHAIKDALAGKKAIAPQAGSLGLTAETSVKTLRELHTLHIAEGISPVGRKIIAESPHAPACHEDQSCLGYLYSAQSPDDEGELPVVRTQGSARLRIEPKLVLRFADAPDTDAGLDGFLDAIDAIAMGAEVLAQAFDGSSWRFEDKICANGFSKTLLVGDLKTLSRSSKKNFSVLLEHSNFSLNRRSGPNWTVVDYTPGFHTSQSSIASLYQIVQRQLAMDAKPIAKGDLVVLNALCAAHPVAAGDEWVCVATGLDLPSLRVRFGK